jgi:hypothetical protein
MVAVCETWMRPQHAAVRWLDQLRRSGLDVLFLQSYLTTLLLAREAAGNSMFV